MMNLEHVMMPEHKCSKADGSMSGSQLEGIPNDTSETICEVKWVIIIVALDTWHKINIHESIQM